MRYDCFYFSKAIIYVFVIKRVNIYDESIVVGLLYMFVVILYSMVKNICQKEIFENNFVMDCLYRRYFFQVRNLDTFKTDLINQIVN